MQREDVYETADLPESDQNLDTIAESFDSEHIEKTRLKAGEAYQHFKGKSLQTDNVDFSDSVIKGKKGYNGGPFFVELVRSVGDEPETLEQQYQRLQNEIRDLASKLEDFKVQKKTLSHIEDQNKSITVSDVVELQQGLKQLQVEQVLGAEVSDTVTTQPCSNVFNEVMTVVENMKSEKKNSSSPTKPVTYELFYSPLMEKNDGGKKEIGALEARLSVVEKRLGGESDKISSIMAETKTKNLMELTETLQQRIALLDNSQLDIVEARLSVLLHKLSQIKDKKSSIDAEQLGRVNELYDMVNKWDVLCSSLPQVVSRLESLKELHEQAVQFSQCLTYLDGVQQELSKTLEIDNTLLNEVKDSCMQNMETLKNNFNNVEKRIKALTDGR